MFHFWIHNLGLDEGHSWLASKGQGKLSGYPARQTLPWYDRILRPDNSDKLATIWLDWPFWKYFYLRKHSELPQQNSNQFYFIFLVSGDLSTNSGLDRFGVWELRSDQILSCKVLGTTPQYLRRVIWPSSYKPARGQRDFFCNLQNHSQILIVVIQGIAH